MKKNIALMLVILVASVGILYGVGTTVNAGKDQVVITEKVMYGNKAAASGITVKSENHYNRHLFWDTTYTFGENSSYETEYSFSASERSESDEHSYMAIAMDVDIAYGCNYELPAEEQKGIARAFKELYDEAKPGEEAKRLIRLKDFYEYYPIGIDIDLPDIRLHGYADSYLNDQYAENDYLYARKVFNEFFKIPVLETEKREISISKDNGGGMSIGIGFSSLDGDSFYMSTVNTYTDDTCFFAINNRTSKDTIVDTSLIPGGYGIYAFLYGKEAKDLKTGIDTDSLKMVYPLDEEVVVRHLTMSQDKTKLLLFTNEGEEVYLTVVDTETMQGLQKFSVGEGTLYEVYEYEDFIVIYSVIVSYGGRISVVEINESGEYEYEFTVDEANKVNEDFEYWKFPTMNFDGERLVIVDYMYRAYTHIPSCGYYMAVYDESGLLYYAEYDSSLSTHPYMGQYSENCLPSGFNRKDTFVIEFAKE